MVTRVVPLREATRAWLAISVQTFGGPAGQIAVMQHTLVDRRRWLGQRRFLHALNYCMLLPGPEAQQLSVYAGWLLNGIRGGLIAGTLFVLPGVAAMLALSAVYVGFGDTEVVTGLFLGLAPAVVAIVVQAVHRLGRRALHHPALVAVAVAALLALTVLGVPFPVVVASAALVGWLLGRRLPSLRSGPATREPADAALPLVPDDALHEDPPARGRTARLLLVGLVLWAAPVALVAALWGPRSVYVDQGLFFAGAALVTFGGAYAVLAFVADQAVNTFGWLASGEMVKGLALAETTPGPLIMVVQFVAFVGAYRDPGPLSPWVAGVVAALLTTWVTFVPSFLLVLLGAPYMERLRSNQALSSSLTGVTAAVVGVIASLAVFFASHTLFAETRQVGAGPLQAEIPVLAAWQPTALALTAVALALMYRRDWSPLRTLGLCALLGLGAHLLW